MTYNIAVAGKGGVGKTSLTGLLIDTLVKQKKTIKSRRGEARHGGLQRQQYRHSRGNR